MADIVCVKCKRLMKILKNGVKATELIDEDGEEYRSYFYDMWECRGCDARVLVGHGAAIYDKSEMHTRPDIKYW